MQAFRRSAQLARTTLAQQSRRYAHHESHAAGGIKYPEEEKLGKGFFIAVSMVPISLVLYKMTRPGDYEHAYFTRVINSYDGYRQEWARIADLHTQAIEQAGADRNLFSNMDRCDTVDLKFPEALNVGAPHNVPAGHYADISKVMAKYEKQAHEANARKLQQVRENKVPSELPYPAQKLPTGAETMLM